MATVPKWTEERTNKLVELVGEGPVSQATVAEVAETLETTTRSISSKLRKMGYEVELAGGAKAKAFSDEQEAALEAFITENSGEFTYGEIAENFANGAFSAKQIQGKILSMELTDCVKPTPKAEAHRTYTEAEEATFLAKVASGAFLEEIAEALGKELNSVRGKALSFLRSGEIQAIPKQRDSKAAVKEDALDSLGDVSGLTVDQLAEKLGKTPRGVRTMLTRRGVKVADYDGAAKKAKLEAAA